MVDRLAQKRKDNLCGRGNRLSPSQSGREVEPRYVWTILLGTHPPLPFHIARNDFVLVTGTRTRPRPGARKRVHRAYSECPVTASPYAHFLSSETRAKSRVLHLVAPPPRGK